MKIALVTGGNRGIGLAIVQRLAAEGYQVLLGCRDETAAAKAINSISGAVTAVRLDLSNPNTLNENLLHLCQRYPQIDILVNNAGILEPSEFTELSQPALANSLQVNTIGAFQVIQYVAKGMMHNGFGRIVNISSGWGAFSEGLTGPPAYAISKAALNALTVVAANALPSYIKVNAMCPGWVRTDMGGYAATRSAEEAADDAFWLITLDEQGPSGKFFRYKKRINW